MKLFNVMLVMIACYSLGFATSAMMGKIKSRVDTRNIYQAGLVRGEANALSHEIEISAGPCSTKITRSALEDLATHGFIGWLAECDEMK